MTSGTATADILGEIVELTTPEFKQPGDFTVNEYIASWNEANAPHSITTGAANGWLDDLIQAGKLVKIDRLYDPEAHRYVNVYRRVEKE